jgi:hypothetical protein
LTSTTDPGREHLLVWEALPWVLNGSATAEQQRLVAGHLPHCADCRAEYAHQQDVLRAVSAPPTDNAPDAEAGLRQLFARIDDEDAQAAQEVAAPPPRRRAANGPLTYALAACVLVQAVGLGLMGLNLAQRDGTQAGYQTLSQPSPAAARVATVRVVPDPGMPLADWDALLRQHRLRVVDGPNRVGAYALAPAAGESPPPAGWLEQLRAAPGVRLAEPIGAIDR